jgi:flap endonuclease-1
MGKKKFNQFLEDNCPNAIKQIDLITFKGKNITIDANNFSYRYFSTAAKTVIKATDLSLGMPDEQKIRTLWINNIISFLCRWMEMGITPVFVFDGEPRPEKSKYTGEERKTLKQAKIGRINELKAKLVDVDPLKQNEKDLRELEQLLIGNPHPTYKDLDCFRDLLKHLGLPWFMAKHDAEQLCAILTIEGFAIATYSADADTLIFGCPQLIIETERNIATVVNLKEVLKGLEMTFGQLADIFILSKTDYNKGLNGMKINRSLETIRKYGKIESIPQIKPGYLDPHSIKGLKKTEEYPLIDLDVENNRKIFRFIPSMGFIKKGSEKMELYNFDNLQNLVIENKLKIDLPYLIDIRGKLQLASREPHQTFYFL